MRKKIIVASSIYVAVFLLWIFYANQGSWLPSPWKVLVRGISSFSILSSHITFTVKTMFFSLGLAIMISLPLSWLMSKVAWMRLAVQSFFILFQCLPMFALAPLMILWFGWTQVAVIVPTTLMLIFPLIINFTKGFSAVPVEYEQLFSIHGASEQEMFFKLRLPYALPFIFSGLRVAISFSGAGAIAGEWAGAQRGLGVFLQECRRDLDVEGLLVGLFCLLFLTLIFYLSLYVLEKVFCKEVRFEAL